MLSKGNLDNSEEEKGKIKAAGINFFNQDNKIRFEINLTSVKNNGMKVSSKLLELATKVHQ
ncbi:MAG: YfiR family protein [Saprospiraceae bacterium]|nr:YfiR family protein [Candidatus Brachybacter algidus]